VKRIALLAATMLACCGCNPLKSLFTLSPVVIILPGGKQTIAINSTENNSRVEAVESKSAPMAPPELEEQPPEAKPEAWKPIL